MKTARLIITHGEYNGFFIRYGKRIGAVYSIDTMTYLRFFIRIMNKPINYETLKMSLREGI